MMDFNAHFRQDDFNSDKNAAKGQDKLMSPTLMPASDQPLTSEQPALNARTNTKPPLHATSGQRNVFAAAWIDADTNAYIEQRKRLQSATRSKVIADMLKERAQDDAFERSQTILVPIIQDTLREEHREYANRDLAITAKIAYEVGKIVPLLIGFFDLYLTADILHDIEARADTTARVNVARRTPQVDEVMQRLKTEMEVQR